MTSEKEVQAGRVLAVFDFDGTLAAKDSLWPFLVAVAGWPRCVLAALSCCMALGALLSGGDLRSKVKAILLDRILKGRRFEDLKPAIERMRTWPQWLPTVDALKKHHEAGDLIVIATGSLDLYVKEMLGSLPYDDILATEMDLRDGVLTGQMTLGNCVRQRKAERVAAYMNQYGPFTDSWGYGNAPHDLPMMALMNHRVVVPSA
ncbi:MAG: HAD family hydrolase [Alphaproteobacteria bacterium]|nr:HAD family hydrolase [Alphaproteobacteria bacterium]